MELEIVGRLIKRFFVNSGRFSPSELIIVTWDRVGPYRNGTEQVCMLMLS